VIANQSKEMTLNKTISIN